MNDAPLTNEKLRKTFFFHEKLLKFRDYDDISFNVINNFFDFIVEPLGHIFNNSLPKRIFSDEPKIASITPIYKGGD